MEQYKFNQSTHKEEGLSKIEQNEIENQISNLLNNWSSILDNKGIKLNEKDLINSDFELESLIKQKIRLIDSDSSKNELYSYTFLEKIEKYIEKMNFDGRSTKRTREYIKQAKLDHYVPGMTEEIMNLSKAA